MVKPTDAELVAEFAGTADRVRDVGQTPSKIVVKVDIYTTALGTLRVTVNREIKTDFALLYDPSMWKQVNLKGRSWFRETPAKTGDNTKIMLAGARPEARRGGKEWVRPCSTRGSTAHKHKDEVRWDNHRTRNESRSKSTHRSK